MARLHVEVDPCFYGYAVLLDGRAPVVLLDTADLRAGPKALADFFEENGKVQSELQYRLDYAPHIRAMPAEDWMTCRQLLRQLCN